MASLSNPPQDPAIEARILGFTHYLRQHNYHLSLHEVNDVIRSLQRFSAPDLKRSRCVFRALCCQTRDQWLEFDQLFQQYWYPQQFTAARKINAPSLSHQNQQGNLVGLSGTSDRHLAENDFQCQGTGAGKQTTLSKANFRFITDRQAMRAVENQAERLAKISSLRLARRYVLHPLGRQLHFRSTIRRNLQNGLSLNQLMFKQRRRKPPQLIILHDISHSMSWNNPLLFRFSRGLIRHFKNSHAFVFHTELFPVTRLYRLESLQHIREHLESDNHLWLGGTSIASSIQHYLDHHASVQSKDSIVLIMSDGFDTDSAQQLAACLEQLKRRSQRIIWLSPMLDNPDYVPAEEFIASTTQYLSAFLPCSSLASLSDAVDHILKHTH